MTKLWTGCAYALLAVLAVSCGKLSDDQKQAASNIVAGLSGGTGSSLASSVGLRASPEVTGRVGDYLRRELDGVLWLTRFRLAEGRSDLVLSTGTCSTGSGTGTCTGSCNTDRTIYTASCSLPDGSGYNCSGTEYTFTSSTFSVSADFSSTGGTQGSATGNFVLGISIASNVTGGNLDGKRLECSVNFTINIAQLKAGTLQRFTPNCSNYSCKYDSKEISCEDIQTKLASSQISCS